MKFYNSTLNDMYYRIKKINEKYKINLTGEVFVEYTHVEINTSYS